MADKKKVEVDETDFNQRVEDFNKELTPILEKYEVGFRPHVGLARDERGVYNIMPDLQIISTRKAKEEKTELIKE